MLTLLAFSKPSEWTPLGYIVSICMYTLDYFTRPSSPPQQQIDHYTKEGCLQCSCLACKPCVCGVPVPSARHFRIMFDDYFPRVYDCTCVSEVPEDIRKDHMTMYFRDILSQDFGDDGVYFSRLLFALLFCKKYLDPHQIAMTIEQEIYKADYLYLDGSCDSERYLNLRKIHTVFFDLKWTADVNPIFFRKSNGVIK